MRLLWRISRKLSSEYSWFDDSRTHGRRLIISADALSQFSADDFTSAGYPSWVRERLSQIASHESDHVSLLSSALGNDSVAACNYSL